MGRGTVASTRHFGFFVWTLFSIVCLGISSGAANAQGAISSSPCKDFDTVKVGGTQSLTFLPFYVARDKGLFEKHCIKLDMIAMPNPIPALIAGEINIALNGSDAAVISAARGKPTPAIVMANIRNSRSIVVRSDIPSKPYESGFPANLEVLRGKTIIINSRGTGSETYMKMILGEAGMVEGRDFSVVVIGSPPAILSALQARTADAAALFPPFQEMAAADNIGVPLVREGFGQGPSKLKPFPGTSAHVNLDYLRANPEVVKRFIAAMVDGNTYARDFEKNKKDLIEIGTRATGLNNPVVMEAVIKMVSALSHPEVDCAAWDQLAQILVEAKTIEAKPQCRDMAAVDVAPMAKP